MPESHADRIVEEVVTAHGGAQYWNNLKAIEAEISAWGLLFRTKRIPVLSRVRVRALTREPRFTFFDFPRPGQLGELVGNEEVCISGSDGRLLARRIHPRAEFRSLRRLFYWDSLDFIYFGGYATWNYLLTPFLFLRDGFVFEEMETGQDKSRAWLRLRVTFPTDIPTHCRTQIFYFDEQRLVRRLDYRAEVVGRWANAAHFCADYRAFDGIQAPTKRRVRPLILGNRPLPGPILVALEVHDMRPMTD